MERAFFSCLAAWLVVGASCGIDVDGSGVDDGQGEGGTGSANASSTLSVGQGTTGSRGMTSDCVEAMERFSMLLTTSDGKKYGCEAPGGTEVGDVTLSGAVVDTSKVGFTLDTCPPNADCAPSLATMEITADGLEVAVPKGAYVRVEVHVEQPMGCAHRVLITNLPSWGGLMNPSGTDANLWLAGADGTYATFADSSFTIDKAPAACNADGGTIKSYDFVLFDADDPAAASAKVPMSVTVTWKVHSGMLDETWRVHDSRSFDSGIPDDAWNWAYWIAP